MTANLIFSAATHEPEMAQMGELVLVGLGLHDEKDISVRGLEEVRDADYVFAELYTSLMEGLDLKKLEKLLRKKIVLVSRRLLEEEDGVQIIAAAKKAKTVFLVPGDPLIATTHVVLRIRAEEAGIETRIIHGASIVSAAIGLSGLQNYKFGKSVTIPFTNGDVVLETPYETVKANLKSGLHTLCFLDVRAGEERYMTINEALKLLLKIETSKQESIVTRKRLVVGIARAGSKSPTVKAGWLAEMLTHDFGRPPHTLIFPGKLHFMEAEALVQLANGPEAIRMQAK
jgi:diphthine synthase